MDLKPKEGIIRETAKIITLATFLALLNPANVSAEDLKKLKSSFSVENITIDPNLKNYGLPDDIFKTLGNWGLNFEGDNVKVPAKIGTIVFPKDSFTLSLTPMSTGKPGAVPNFIFGIDNKFISDKDTEIIIQFNGEVNPNKVDEKALLNYFGFRVNHRLN